MIPRIATALICLLFAAIATAASVRPAPTPETVLFKGYKDVSIGMSAAEARDKLGSPKEKSDASDLYIFSDEESAQLYYDAGKVSAIMVTYSGDLTKAPTPKAVFGTDVEANAEGGIFKMVRYPKAGFWISYNRTTGDDAIVSIAMQKI